MIRKSTVLITKPGGPMSYLAERNRGWREPWYSILKSLSVSFHERNLLSGIV